MAVLKFFLILFLVIGLIFEFDAYAQNVASPFALEILNIKPAGTGSPAIPATNRIFSAYPGIEYNIRAAVIGGRYPYRFALSNAPSGMTINQNTGEISWPNPQANSGTITLTVTDSANATAQTSWAITVGTSGFIFVDASYSGTQTGSITQPYSSLSNMLNATSGNTTGIVYFRQGTYPLFQYNASGPGTNMANNPRTLLAYPGETVIFEGNNGYRFVILGYFYFDGITIRNVLDYGVIGCGNSPYTTVRRTAFNYIRSSTGVNNNQGFIFLADCGAGGFGPFILNNTFNDFAGAHGVGSLYFTYKALVEGNVMTEGGKSGLIPFSEPVAVKGTNESPTIRGNRFYAPSNTVEWVIYNQSDPPNNRMDFSYNLVLSVATYAQNFAIFYLNSTYIYRNTFVNWNILNTDLNSGLHYWTYNVFVDSPRSGSGISRVTQSDNLSGSRTDNIIDSNGNLTSAYAQYLGTHGYQIVQGESQSILPPVNFRIIFSD